MRAQFWVMISRTVAIHAPKDLAAKGTNPNCKLRLSLRYHWVISSGEAPETIILSLYNRISAKGRFP